MTQQPNMYSPQPQPPIQTAVRKPVWPKVIAIISLVFAGMGIVMTPVMAVVNRLNPMTRDMMDAFPEWYPPYQIVSGMGLGALLLIAGILLLKHKPAAVPLYILYAVLTIANSIVVLIPALEALNSMTRDAPAPVRMGARMGILIGIPMGMLIPGFVLYWFCRSKTRQDLAMLNAPRQAATPLGR